MRFLSARRPSALIPGSITFLLQAAALMVVVRSVEAAGWVDTPPLTLVVLIAALMAGAVVGLPGQARVHHLGALVLGLFVTYVAALTLVEAQGLGQRFQELHERLGDWWSAVVSRDATLDTLPLSMILMFITWLVGYFGSWALFRYRNVWATLLPLGMGLLINLTYLPERYFWYFFAYLLIALLLLTHVTSLRRRSELGRQGVMYPASTHGALFGHALWITGIAVALAVAVPLGDSGPRPLKEVFKPAQEQVNWAREELHRLLAGVPRHKFQSMRFFGSVLPLVRPVPVAEDPIFFAETPYQLYWRARVYDEYTSTAWKVEKTQDQLVFTAQPTIEEEEEFQIIVPPSDVVYHIELFVNSPYLIASGVALDITMPVQREIAFSSETEEFLRLPTGFDVLSMKPVDRLRQGSRYTVEADLDTATVAALRQSSQDYPPEIRERYLQLPDKLPPRVGELAISLTEQASNPYDKAMAIEAYLRTLAYTTGSPPLPFDADAVDHFLFQTKAGYSDYFASAMVVMLRSVDIPARLVFGFAPGVREPENSGFVVRDRDNHTWPEAYFPGYGWVEFEPTPIYPSRTRGQPVNAFGPGGLVIQTGAEEVPPEEEEPKEEEISVGGRLPGGFGFPPIPLSYFGSPMGGGGALFGALLLIGMVGWWLMWRRSYVVLRTPETAYEKLHRLARSLGIASAPSQTPAEVAQTLSRVVPERQSDLSLICDTYVKYRYGRISPQGREGFQVRRAWDRVRRALVARLMTPVRT